MRPIQSNPLRVRSNKLTVCGSSTKLVSEWDAADFLGRLNDNTEELVRLLGGFRVLSFGQLSKLC